jgi:predicted RNA-binding Zn ribbon-like protein
MEIVLGNERWVTAGGCAGGASSRMAKHGFWFEGGRLSLDFIATSSPRSGELLPAPVDLAAWLVAAGLTERPPLLSGEEFDNAHALRAALSRVVLAVVGDGTVHRGDLKLTNDAASQQAPLRLLGLRGGELVGREAAPQVDQCLGVIAQDAIDLLAGPQRALLRSCAAEDCSGIYVDLSRGRRRKWCTTTGCGNRARVSAHRTRRKAISPTTVDT